MVEHVKLVKLRYEIPVGMVSNMHLKILYSAVRTTLFRNIAMYKRLSNRDYPIPFKKLQRMCKAGRRGSIYIIGIWPDDLKGQDYQDYLKVLDAEFGVTDLEQRVLRRTLEECLIKSR